MPLFPTQPMGWCILGGQECFCIFACRGDKVVPASDTCSWYLFYTQPGLGRNHNLYCLKKSLFQEKAPAGIQLAVCLNLLLFPRHSSSSAHPQFLAQQQVMVSNTAKGPQSCQIAGYSMPGTTIFPGVVGTGQLCSTLPALEHDSHLPLQVSVKPRTPTVQWSGG